MNKLKNQKHKLKEYTDSNVRSEGIMITDSFDDKSMAKINPRTGENKVKCNVWRFWMFR